MTENFDVRSGQKYRIVVHLIPIYTHTHINSQKSTLIDFVGVHPYSVVLFYCFSTTAAATFGALAFLGVAVFLGAAADVAFLTLGAAVLAFLVPVAFAALDTVGLAFFGAADLVTVVFLTDVFFGFVVAVVVEALVFFTGA
jgi:hypothetical protein